MHLAFRDITNQKLDIRYRIGIRAKYQISNTVATDLLNVLSNEVSFRIVLVQMYFVIRNNYRCTYCTCRVWQYVQN